jgi:uncharacterized lipoprotein YddW (UPF0748 family)
MKIEIKKILILFVINLISLQVLGQTSITQTTPKRELRGVWIATVANIDWPSDKDDKTSDQKDQYKAILDEHKREGINTVFTQVRPAADALYAKSKEPWSLWLTGQQGRMPYPYYDPMEFMIKESHARAMEFHAWLNPYRATHKSARGVVSNKHITKMKPEWFFAYDGQKIFNPGIPEVRSYIVSVVMDIVRNYDVDGIHFDDYFYPYPDATNTPIPDEDTFKKYPNGFTNIKDWRRNNVDLLIKMVHDSIATVKPYVKFGISPFGIWQNNDTSVYGSKTKGGSSYSTQYADTRKWLKEGWVDYMLPQVYFNIGHPLADFETITEWWDKNAFGRHIYIGMGVYKAGSDQVWKKPTHLPEELLITRSYSNIKGQTYYSSKSLRKNLSGFADSLANNYYRYPAIQPVMEWKDNVPPNPPQGLTAVQTNLSVVQLSWEPPTVASDGDAARGYVIYRIVEGTTFDPNDARNILDIIYDRTYYIDSETKIDQNYVYLVSSLDRLQNESRDFQKAVVELR